MDAAAGRARDRPRLGERCDSHNMSLVLGIIFGPPGSGKGTQAELITDALGTVHISTGDLLRAEAEAGSPLGREVAPLLEAGHLGADELIRAVGEPGRRMRDAACGAPPGGD